VTYHELGHTLGYTHADCGLMTGASHAESGSGIPETSVMTDMDINGNFGGNYLEDSTREIAGSCPNITLANHKDDQLINDVTNEYVQDEITNTELNWHVPKHIQDDPTDMVFLSSDWVDMIGLKDQNTDYNWSAIEDDVYFGGTYITWTTPITPFKAYPNCPWQFGAPSSNQPYQPDTWDDTVTSIGGGYRSIEDPDDYPQNDRDKRDEACGNCP